MKTPGHFALLLLSAVALTTAAFAQTSPPQFVEYGPILPSERDVPQPSRDVAARDYRDAFCADWTDGCEECRRSGVNDEPTCASDPRALKDGACQRKPIKCGEMLPSANRVCLRYFDGCNEGDFFGADGGLLCGVKKPGGTLGPPPPPNFICTTARASRYDNDGDYTEEWNGTWRLQAPNGASCVISYGTTIPLAGDADCLKLLLVSRFQQVSVDAGRLEFVGSQSFSPLKVFKPGSSFEHLIDAAGAGWSLNRIDAAPVQLDLFEGTWNLLVEGKGELCRVMLTVSDLSRQDGLRILTPALIAKTSECAKETPDWKRWGVRDNRLEFLDESGRATTLSRSRVTDCYVGMLPGPKPRAFAISFMGRARMGVGGEHDCKGDFERGAK